MKQEKNKRELEEILHDVSVSVYWGLKDSSTVESNLSEAKSSAKKLIEKIEEYLESQEREFKVGDYVALDIPNKKIVKVDRLNGDALHGLWYDTEGKNIQQNFYFGSGIGIRHATPTEISEYEVALNFHKHGRKPFEVKKDDILLEDGNYKFFVNDPEIWGREDFVSGGYTFAKTVEEVNEWIKGE